MKTPISPAQGRCANGSVLIESLMALFVLGVTLVVCLHLATQRLQMQARVQQWFHAIGHLDNATAFLHRWPQSLTEWQQFDPRLTSASPTVSCSRTPCDAAQWSASEVQAWSRGLTPLGSGVSSSWLPPEAIAWQAGDSRLVLHLHTWQFTWGEGDTGSIRLHLVP